MFLADAVPARNSPPRRRSRKGGWPKKRSRPSTGRCPIPRTLGRNAIEYERTLKIVTSRSARWCWILLSIQSGFDLSRYPQHPDEESVEAEESGDISEGEVW